MRSTVGASSSFGRGEATLRDDPDMTLTVLLFASYADALGRGSVELPLERGATVRDVIAGLATLPGADRLPPRPLVAVNQELAPYDRCLAAGDEVAVIPPVAGG